MDVLEKNSSLLIICLLMAAFCLFAFSCAKQKQSPSTAKYTDITVEEAKEIIEAGNVILVDVRTQEEYNEKHIDGAILIPNETITDSQPAELPDKDADILVYCRSGKRSSEAAKKLADMGYTNVYNMLGGTNEWPYETK